jgi:glycopeptide antibiotics resistance protein
MNKSLLRCSGISLWFLAACCLAVYILSFAAIPHAMQPAEKVALLLLLCLAAWFGSTLFGKTLPDALAKKLIHTSFLLFFILYMSLILFFTLFEAAFGRSGFTLARITDAEQHRRFWAGYVNFIPFATIVRQTAEFFRGELSAGALARNTLGNLVAFSPLALFFPLLFPRLRRFRRFLFAMLALVCTVELLQFVLLTGFCDVDDVILNVGGACLLYALFQKPAVCRCLKKITRQED